MPRFLAALLAWLAVTDNRRRIYETVRIAAPALAGLGLFAPAEITSVLVIVQAVLGLTAGVLGAANTTAAARAWLYSLTAAVSAFLVFRGVLDAGTVALWLPVLAAVLSVGGTTLSIKHLPEPAPLVDGAYRITLKADVDTTVLDSARQELQKLTAPRAPDTPGIDPADPPPDGTPGPGGEG